MAKKNAARLRLAAIRQQLGLSQELMGEALGTTLRTYQRWESGESRMPGDALVEAEEMLRRPPNVDRLRAAVKRKK